MKRLVFVALAFLVGCNGMGGGRVVPAANPEETATGAGRSAGWIANARRTRIKVKLTLTVPRRRRGERARSKHPATISGLTKSVSVAIDGAAASIFNATPASPGCSIVSNGTTCTFAVDAPVGSDTFVISTYSGTSAGGTMLDRGSGVFAIATGKNNAVSITLGPVVSTSADSGIGSLRYAIGSANAGDTILLMLAAGSTIALTSAPITISKRVSIAGPGVTASVRHRGGRRASTTYSGVTISGGGARQLFIINPGATARISGLILTGGSAAIADNPGGAIANAGTLTLAGDVFTANTSTVESPLVRRVHAPRAMHAYLAPADRGPRAPLPRKVIVLPQRRPHGCVITSSEGGALYNNGALSVSGTTFDGNVVAVAAGPCTTSSGGAIYNDVDGTLASSGNTYTNNAAYEGGAVYNNGTNGQASFAGDTFDANLGCTAASGCPTSGCTTTGFCTSYAAGSGAAIYDGNGPGISVTNGIFENNVAGGNSPDSLGEGGALYLDSGSPTVTGSTFSGNLAGGGTLNCSAGEGGAIYVNGANTLAIDNDAFTGNQAAGDQDGVGGAILGEAPIDGSGDTFTSNVANGSASACFAAAEGIAGAIFADGGATLSNSTFSANAATSAVVGNAGAFFSGGPSRLIGDTFTSNEAIGTGVSGSATAGFGGAVYNGNTLTMSGSTFTSNSAQASGIGKDVYGGAIDGEGPMSSSNDTFTSNQAVGGGQPDEFGGAIYNDAGLVSSGDTFKSNVVSGSGRSFGGAMFSDAPLTLTGGTFASNSASGPEAGGGGIFSAFGSTISNSVFTSNVASSPLNGEGGTGGAILDDAGLTLSGSTLNGNSATQAGGAFFSEADDAILNSTISGNQVSAAKSNDGGGGIYTDAVVTLVSSTVSGNSVTATGYWAGGGGIYDYGGLSMVGSTVSGNTVLGTIANSGGGGIFAANDATILNSTIDGNDSSVDGGGIETFANSYTVNLTNVTLFANAAAGSGGNIDNPYALNLGSSIVAGGTAASGPDISNTGTLTSQDYNVIQTAVAGNALAGTTTHDLQTTPLLLGLANNSGPTFTNAEQAGSRTVGLIPFAAGACGSNGNGFDQRGFARGAGGVCDAGAFELGGVPSAARQAPPRLSARRHHHHRLRPRAPHPTMPLYVPAQR